MVTLFGAEEVGGCEQLATMAFLFYTLYLGNVTISFERACDLTFSFTGELGFIAHACIISRVC